MTNLQRLQTMTAEELAVFLANVKGEALYGANRAVYYGLFGTTENTPVEREKREVLAWLNEECDSLEAKG